jgi:hypothetical protein
MTVNQFGLERALAMHTESRTSGLILAYSVVAWLIAGVLVTNFGPHVSMTEWIFHRMVLMKEDT